MKLTVLKDTAFAPLALSKVPATCFRAAEEVVTVEGPLRTKVSKSSLNYGKYIMIRMWILILSKNSLRT